MSENIWQNYNQKLGSTMLEQHKECKNYNAHNKDAPYSLSFVF